MERPHLIVIVEDDSDERTALGRVLRAGGFDVTSYGSAEDFLYAPPTKALCLVLDIKLGGVSGLELMRIIRAQASTVPVVVITASEDSSTREEATRLGCTAYLRKPFEGRGLISLLNDLALSRQSASASADLGH